MTNSNFPNWVRAFFYQRLSNGTLSIAKLYPAMQGSGNEYLYKTEQRDFFYFTRVAATWRYCENSNIKVQREAE